MIRFTKEGMLLYCSRCAHESTSIRDYIMHKKETHGVRVNDSIDALQTIGLEDLLVFEELREKYKKEKYDSDWKKRAKEDLKEHLKQNDFWQTKRDTFR